jgi:DNA-binding NarL/FixJ family response regulator
MRWVILDDSMIFLRKLAQFLRTGGHQVVGMAQTGEEAIALCEREKPDAVMFDWSMPGMNGAMAMQQVLDRGLARYYFMATSFTSKQEKKSLLDQGVIFIQKPYHEEILTLIERALHRADDGSPAGA